MDGPRLAELATSNGADLALQPLREVDGPNTVMQELKGSLGGSTSSSYCPAPLIRLISGRVGVWRGRGDLRPSWF